MSSGSTIDNENKLIARMVGTKFDAMLALHNRLPELVRLSDFLTKLMGVYDNLGGVVAVEAALPELLELSGSVESLEELNDLLQANLVAIQNAAQNAQDAEQAANIAKAFANFKGNFIPGTTSALIGESYKYSNQFWLTVNNTIESPNSSSNNWVLAPGTDAVNISYGGSSVKIALDNLKTTNDNQDTDISNTVNSINALKNAVLLPPLFTFTEGGLLTNKYQLVRDVTTKSNFYYIGVHDFNVTPLEITAGLNPVDNSDWISLSIFLHNMLSDRNAAGAHDASAINIGGNSLDAHLTTKIGERAFGCDSFISDFRGDGVLLRPVNLTNGNGLIETYRKIGINKLLKEDFVKGRPSGGDSIDNTCDAWRLGPSVIFNDYLCYFKTATVLSGTPATYNAKLTHHSTNGPSIPFYQFPGAGALEFNVGNRANNEKEISIIYAGGTNTQQITISLLVNDVVVSSSTHQTALSGGSPLTSAVIELKNPSYKTGRDLKIKIEGSDPSKYFYVAGICSNIDDVGPICDTMSLGANAVTSNDVRPVQSGAMCYVFRESETGLFGGESHGGETVLASAWRSESLGFTPVVGDFVFSKKISVAQSTFIQWPNGKTISCRTIHTIENNCKTKFYGNFAPSAGFYADLSYVPMLTLSSINWRRLIFPTYFDANQLPDPQVFSTDKCINSLVMQSVDNDKFAGVTFSSSMYESDKMMGYIKPYGGSDTKLYAGPNTSVTPKLVSNFVSEQIRFVC